MCTVESAGVPDTTCNQQGRHRIRASKRQDPQVLMVGFEESTMSELSFLFSDAQVIGVARGVNEVFALTHQSNPDLVVVGPFGDDSTDAMRAFRSARSAVPGIEILVIASSTNVHDVLWYQNNETDGYVTLGPDFPGDVSTLVTRTIAHRQPTSRYVATTLLAAADPADGMEPFPLSPIETEVLTLRSIGFTNHAVAEHLGTQIEEIDRHLHGIFHSPDRWGAGSDQEDSESALDQ